MTKIMTEVKDVQRIREAAAGAIISPYEAIAQYIANSTDSYKNMGTAGIVEVQFNRVTVPRQGTYLDSIVVRDWAEGMSQDKIESIPISLGASEQANVEGSNAYFQLGHLSFMIMAGNCLYQSHASNGVRSSLKMTADSAACYANEDLENMLEGRREKPGTDVIISDISESYRKGRLTAERAALELASKFRGSLGRNMSLRIVGTLNGKVTSSEEVEKTPYAGELILQGSYEREMIQPVEVEIHYSPGSSRADGVVLLHSGEAYGLLGDTPLDDRGLWSRNGLVGEITFDSGIPNTQKTGVLYRGKEIEELRSILTEIEPIVKAEVERIDTEYRASKNQESYQHINRALAESIRELPFLTVPLSDTERRDRSIERLVLSPQSLANEMNRAGYNALSLGDKAGYEGKLIEAYLQSDSGSKLPNDLKVQILNILPNVDTHRPRGSGGDRITQNREDATVQPLDEGLEATLGPKTQGEDRMAIVSRHPSTSRRTRLPNLGIVERNMNNRLQMSDYDPSSGVITVNTAHPLYETEAAHGTPSQKERYLAKIVAQEIVADQLEDVSPKVMGEAMMMLLIQMEQNLRNN